MKVAVGSKNPVKVEAVKQAFKKVFPNEKWEVIGLEVSSGVSDQPMSDEESITGARNRAKKSLLEAKSDYGVGLEAGLQFAHNIWLLRAWVVIVNADSKEGVGATVSMQMSPKHMELIKQGLELGDADDRLFNMENSKHKMGYFGNITNGNVPRMESLSDGVVGALANFIHPELF